MRKATAALFVLVALAPAPGSAQAWAEKMFKDPDAKDNPLVHDFGSVPRGSQLFHRFKITNLHASCGCGTPKATKTKLQPRESGYVEVTLDTKRFNGPKKVTVSVTVGPEYVSTADLQLSFNSRGDIVFNPGQVNFGVVPRGKASDKQEIDVEYAGALDWKVTEVVASDAPLEVSFKEWYRRAGKATANEVGYKISVALKADAPAGPLKQDIYLKTNDPACPLLPVLVEATVQAPLAVLPEKAEFGSVPVGQSATKRIVVKGMKPFKIVGIEGQEEGITAETPEPAGETHFVTIKWQPDKAGDLKRQLTVKTDLDKDATIAIPVEGTAVAQ
ncbi:MAG TPA: DUF1573 domain-containing protein [Gemmataceae bacterium]|nr:DUF1573 domain-containing protein [Gemmataceae bacterium]